MFVLLQADGAQDPKVSRLPTKAKTGSGRSRNPRRISTKKTVILTEALRLSSSAKLARAVIKKSSNE
jgi:hypothetical protein